MKRHCDMCDKLHKNLTKHLIMAHALTKDEAYSIMLAKYPDFFASCIICDMKINKPASAGGRMTCSDECSKAAKRRVNLGRKQSETVIKTRIANTDQVKKQSSREKTMLERYGSLYAPKDPEARRAKLAKKKIPRTECHQRKIIEAKRRNGTLNHSRQTKEKIKKSINTIYQSDDPPCTISNGSPKGYETGYVSGLSYRSSYEKRFLEYCQHSGILVQSASTKHFRIKYYDADGKQHYYYPDFYLPEYECVIEIKPAKMLNEGLNTLKINAAHEKYQFQFKLVTEYELENLVLFFNQLGSLK